MPSGENYVRDYEQEAKYHATDKQKKNRASRNAARNEYKKTGQVHKGDNRDVEHIDGNPTNNSRSNLRITSRSSNRSFARNKKAGKKHA